MVYGTVVGSTSHSRLPPATLGLCSCRCNRTRDLMRAGWRHNHGLEELAQLIEKPLMTRTPSGQRESEERANQPTSPSIL